jgi:hypothetical protein
MPVILLERDWSERLGEEPASEAELLAPLKPCPDDALKIWPVGKAVGNVKTIARAQRQIGFTVFAKVPTRSIAVLHIGTSGGVRRSRLLYFNAYDLRRGSFV